jgi:hypothetical protein
MSKAFDEEVARQILRIFAAHHAHSGSMLRRNQFFNVRDGDFQRGLNKAIEKDWIRLSKRDRYTYSPTQALPKSRNFLPSLTQPD